MAHDPDLLDQLERLPSQPWSGTVYRYTGGRRSPDRENTLGARWNPPECGAIYTALDRETLVAEFEYHLAAMTPTPKRSAFTLHSIRVAVGSVIDLRGPGVLEKLGLGGDDLRGDDHAPCRRVGGAAEWLRRGGLLVPSARRPEGSNLVIFPGRQDDDYLFETLGDPESMGSRENR